ncbi:MAG: zonular occludens toxin domain-containing protein [Dehalogenimonas sp.]
MEIKLEGKTAVIAGLRGSGKSNLADVLAENYGGSCLIYDTLGEYSGSAAYNRYVPNDRGSVAELERVIRACMRSCKYRLIIIDEAHRAAPPKPAPLSLAIRDLNDFCRHKQYNISVVFITQRPVKLHQDITEQADYLFLFRLAGKNDQNYLNELAAGLGDAVQALPDYHFYLCD